MVPGNRPVKLSVKAPAPVAPIPISRRGRLEVGALENTDERN